MLSARFINWVVHRPWMAIGVSLLLVGILTAGLKDYHVTNNPRSFFNTHNPAFLQLERLENQYGNREMVVFVVHPKNGNIFTRDSLDLLEQLTEAGWKMPNAIRSSSLVNFQYTKVDGDDLDTESLVENARDLTTQQIANIRRIALNEPSLVRSAVSPKGDVATVLVNVTMDPERRQAPAIAAWAEAKRDEFKARYPNDNIMVTGTVVFSDAMAKATEDGIRKTFPLGILAAVILLWVFLRSGLGTLFTMSVVFLSVLGALGAAAAMGIVFQPVTSFSPVIILTLSLADSMHLLISYQQQLSKGHGKIEAMKESLRVNLQPVILTSVTTAIGFLSLNTSDSPPFRDLGNIVSIGVILALWLALVFLPAVCMVTPAPNIKQGEGANQRAMMRFTEWVIRYRKLLVIAMLALMVLPSSQITKNELTDVWTDYFDSSFAVRRANDFLAEHMDGLHRLEMSIPARNAGGVVDPEYLRNLEKFRAWAVAQPEVAYVTTFSDVIKRLNRDMNGGNPAYYSIPDNRQLASQYLLMFEMSLPFGLGLDNAISMNRDASLFAMVLHRTNSANILRFKDRAETWMKANLPAYMQVPVSGLDVMFATATKRNIHSLMRGLGFSFALITIVMIISLRSFKYGLYSMLPNIAPCAMAFGIWALLRGKVGLTDSIVACITLGIVVDDTIHFLSKYVRARREMGLEPIAAVRYSMAHVGVAIVATTVVLVADFAVLMTSHFYPSTSLGFLTCLTLIIALAVDLLFLPPFLMVFERVRAAQPAGNAAPRTEPALEKGGEP